MGKLLLLGYFGAGNLGDDGFVVDFLKRWQPELRSRGLTCDYTAAGSRNPLEGFAEAGEIRDLLGKEVSRKALLTVRPSSYDAMVAPGGSLLQNATSMRSLLFYLHVISRFANAGAPVFMLGQGLGPFKGKLAGPLVANTLKHVKLLTLRDRASFEWVQTERIPGALLSADPLLAGKLQSSLGRASGCEARYAVYIPKPSRKTALMPSAWVGLEQSGRVAEHLVTPQYFLAEYLYGLSNYDLEILALHLGQDSKLVDDLAGAGDGYSLNPYEHTAADVLNIIEHGHMVVSYRLHGLILAAAMGVPAFGVAYDPKVIAFCLEMGLPYCTPSEVVGGSAPPLIEHLWHNREQVKATMFERRAAALQRLESAEVHFAQLIWGGS